MLSTERYIRLTPEERMSQLFEDFTPEKILVTSSFGTTSGIVLSLLSKVSPGHPVYFLDTTYHFAETHQYRQTLTRLLNLNVVHVLPEEWKNRFTQQDQTWSKDPDLCCSINKVEPLDRIKPQFNIWISGLMQSQNSFRKTLDIFDARKDITKFYPIIDFTQEQAMQYMKENNIPDHPLLKHGFHSVGCIHCTVKGRGREGRWVNRSKTECGLHI
ncbi:MAG: phosphoadenylyl-sulfate reductase [Bacteroidia bacterium]